MAAVVALIAFYAVGFANNVYAWLRLHGAEKSSSQPQLLSLQFVLNIWNIINHAGAELSNQQIWFFLSTVSSFLSIYCLAALMLFIGMGNYYSQSFNSKRFITVFLAVCTALFHFFGRRDVFCKNGNCFGLSLANAESSEGAETILAGTVVVFTFIPICVCITVSTYIGLLKYNRLKASKPELKFLQVCLRVNHACPVLNFFIYGFLVIEVLQRYYGIKGIDASPLDLSCRLICLDDHLYLLLSMFPVYMVHFLKKNKRSLPKQYQEN